MAFTFGEGEMRWYSIMRAEASPPFCEGESEEHSLFICPSHTLMP